MGYRKSLEPDVFQSAGELVVQEAWEMDRAGNEQRVKHIIGILGREYPNARTALHFTNPLELLLAAVLSAQCTDERVNKVTRSPTGKLDHRDCPACFR